MSYAKNIVDGINYRSGKLKTTTYQDAIFYVSFFESIVAFHINRAVSAEKSVPLENEGEILAAVDFRHSDSPIGWAVESATRRYIGLRTLPVIGPVLAWTWKRLRVVVLWALSCKSAFSVRKYFRF